MRRRRTVASIMGTCDEFLMAVLCFCVALRGLVDGTGTGTGTSAGTNCRSRRLACLHDSVCSKGFNAYYLSCVANAYGSDSQCGFGCRKALAMLLLAPNATGEEFLTCNCSSQNTRCIEDQEKVSECYAKVQLARSSLEADIPTELGCSTVYALCSADEVCLAKWKRMRRECPAMLLGRNCNEECRNAVAKLYTHAVGRGFNACQCDGDGDHEFPKFDCVRYRKNQDPLCSKPLPPRVTTETNKDDVSLLVANSTAQSGKYNIVSDLEKNDTISKNKGKQSDVMVVTDSSGASEILKQYSLWLTVSLSVIFTL